MLRSESVWVTSSSGVNLSCIIDIGKHDLLHTGPGSISRSILSLNGKCQKYIHFPIFSCGERARQEIRTSLEPYHSHPSFEETNLGWHGISNRTWGFSESKGNLHLIWWAAAWSCVTLQHLCTEGSVFNGKYCLSHHHCHIAICISWVFTFNVS